MAVLKAAQRNRLATSEFGLPKQRKYPMPDREHAHIAESYATKEERAGKLSAADEAKIKRKAKKILGKKGTHSYSFRER